MPDGLIKTAVYLVSLRYSTVQYSDGYTVQFRPDGLIKTGVYLDSSRYSTVQ